MLTNFKSTSICVKNTKVQIGQKMAIRSEDMMP